MVKPIKSLRYIHVNGEKYGVMAKGQKNRRVDYLPSPNLLLWLFFSAKRQWSREPSTRRNHFTPCVPLKKIFFLTAYASYLVELTDRSTDEKKKILIYLNYLYQTLTYLNEGYDPEIIKNIYEMKMLNVLGLHPILNQCAVCGSNGGDIFFFNKRRWFHLSSLYT